MARMPETQFACTADKKICWKAIAKVSPGDTKSSVKVGVKVTHVWFIRDRFNLNPGFVEQDALDVAARRHIDAIWVDSESDARAMASGV